MEMNAKIAIENIPVSKEAFEFLKEIFGMLSMNAEVRVTFSEAKV